MGHTDADAQGDGLAEDLEGLLTGVSNPAGGCGGALEGGPVEDDGELVTAHPGHAYAGIHRCYEPPADFGTSLALASSFLERRWKLRTQCGLVAVAVPLVFELVMRGRFTISLLPIMGAYAVGTLWAELTLTRPVGDVARASLATRRVSQYLSPTWLGVQRISALVAVGSLAAPTQLAQRAPGDVQLPSDSVSWMWVAAAVGIAAVAEVAEWWIVRRPQPATTPELLAADDAIRSDSVHAIAGVAVGVLVLWASTSIVYVINGSAVLLVAGFCLAMVLWRWCARTVRQVGRTAASEVIGTKSAV